MRPTPRHVILVILAVALVGTSVTVAGRASATTYERIAAALSLRLSVSVGVPGTSLLVSGTGFSSGERVDLFVGTRAAGAVTAAVDGSFTGARITVPAATPPGTVPVLANGRYSRFTTEASLLIQSSWGQFGHDSAHTNANPDENVIGPHNVAGLSATGFSGLAEGAGPLTVANGDVFLSYENGTGLSAVPISGWPPRWTHSDPNAGNGITVATRTRVFYRSGSDIQALDSRTGAGIWRSSIAPSGSGWAVAGFSYADGALYVLAGYSDGESLYRLSATTGAVLWQSYGPYDANQRPAVADGVVYVRGPGGAIQSLDAATGKAGWSTLVPSTSPGLLTVSGGSTASVISPFPYGLAVLDAATGKVRWTSSSGVTGDVAVFADRVICNGFDFAAGRERVTALDLATGARLWSSDVAGGSPVIANGIVYTGSDQRVFALDLASGKLLATLNLLEQDPNSLPYLDGPVSVVDGNVLAPLQFYGNHFDGAAVDRFSLPDRDGVPPVRSVDDTVSGTADGQFRYTGGWVAGSRAGAYQDTFHYARSKGASATVAFSGLGARLWYSTALNFGKITVRIDGGPTVTLDQSSPVSRNGVKSWTSGQLPSGRHTLVVASVDASVANVDRLDVGTF